MGRGVRRLCSELICQSFYGLKTQLSAQDLSAQGAFRRQRQRLKVKTLKRIGNFVRRYDADVVSESLHT